MRRLFSFTPQSYQPMGSLTLGPPRNSWYSTTIAPCHSLYHSCYIPHLFHDFFFFAQPEALTHLPHAPPMPTPSDSTDQLPLQPESRFQRQLHTTCPPDDDRPGQWRVEVLDRLGRAGLDNTPHVGTPLQHEASSTGPESPGPNDIANDSAERKTSNQSTTMEPPEPSPALPEASPSGSHIDDKDGEPVQPTPTTSSTLDLQYSIQYGIDSTRVRRSR